MKKVKLFGLFLASAAVITACSPKPQGEDAEVSEAQEVEAVAETSVAYALNTETSKVTWIGSKVTGKHDGTIGISEGSISMEGSNIVGGKVVIDMNTVDNTDLKENKDMYDKLVGHLKSGDFFDVENHPKAEFEITAVESYNPDENLEVKEEYDSEFKPAAANEHVVASPTHKVTGNFTLRGKTLSITFPAQIEMAEGSLKAMAKFNIDRTLWDVKYGDEASAIDKAKDKFVYNTVNVGFEIEASTPAM